MLLAEVIIHVLALPRQQAVVMEAILKLKTAVETTVQEIRRLILVNKVMPIMQSIHIDLQHHQVPVIEVVRRHLNIANQVTNIPLCKFQRDLKAHLGAWAVLLTLEVVFHPNAPAGWVFLLLR